MAWRWRGDRRGRPVGTVADRRGGIMIGEVVTWPWRRVRSRWRLSYSVQRILRQVEQGTIPVSAPQTGQGRRKRSARISWAIHSFPRWSDRHRVCQNCFSRVLRLELPTMVCPVCRLTPRTYGNCSGANPTGGAKRQRKFLAIGPQGVRQCKLKRPRGNGLLLNPRGGWVASVSVVRRWIPCGMGGRPTNRSLRRRYENKVPRLTKLVGTLGRVTDPPANWMRVVVLSTALI